MDVRCPQCARLVSAESANCPRCGASLTVPPRLNWLVRLFWTCPSCGSEEPLIMNQPLFGDPSLACRVCRAFWLLNDATRELVQFDPTTKVIRERHTIEEWLTKLPPALTWRPIPAPQLLLFPGETCFLRIERASMLDPRPSVRERQPLGRVEILPGIFERVATDPYGPSPSTLKIAARGPLFATDRRVVFFGDRKQVEIPFARLDGVEVDEGFLLLHRTARTDTFGFDGESASRVREAILLLMRGETGESGVSTDQDTTDLPTPI
jgi:hypothetical protein